DDAFEVSRQVGGVAAPLLRQVGQLAQLSQGNGGGHIAQTVVVAKLAAVVALVLTVGAQPPQALGQLRVVRRQHAALAGGHVLGRVKGEAAGAEAAGSPAVHGGAVGLGCVLDDGEAVPAGDVGDSSHVAKAPVEVHRQ